MKLKDLIMDEVIDFSYYLMTETAGY